MFFSGDSSTRKRVDLGGRSTKERDRQKLLEQTRLERNRRLWIRQQNLAALKIQPLDHSLCEETLTGRKTETNYRTIRAATAAVRRPDMEPPFIARSRSPQSIQKGKLDDFFI